MIKENTTCTQQIRIDIRPWNMQLVAEQLKKGVICFSPLAQGLLSDRYLEGIPSDSRIRTDGRFLKEEAITDRHVALLRELNAIAAERGETLSQMALKWILKDDVITSVLVGASKASQVITNLGVLESKTFTEEEIRKIDAIAAEW